MSAGRAGRVRGVTVVDTETPRGLARARIEGSAGGANGLVVLGHGAGGGVDSADLQAAARAGLASGFVVALVEQPYRVAGRKAPPPIAHADEAWRVIVADLRGRYPDGPLVVGGRSYGARVACRTASDVGADGVVCLAFPLVAPSGKDRSAELAAPECPVLVVQGRSDPFGMPKRRIGRRVVVVEGTHTLDKDTVRIERDIRSWLRDRLA